MDNQKPAKEIPELSDGYKIEDRLAGEPGGDYPGKIIMAGREGVTLTQLANPDYLSLALVLTEAYDQASAGKGHERHAYGEPFEEQDIVTEAVTLGLAAPAFQARKKTKEALRLFERHDANRAIPDLLGAINYIAAIIIAMRIKENKKTKLGGGQCGRSLANCEVKVSQDENQEAPPCEN